MCSCSCYGDSSLSEAAREVSPFRCCIFYGGCTARIEEVTAMGARVSGLFGLKMLSFGSGGWFFGSLRRWCDPVLSSRSQQSCRLWLLVNYLLGHVASVSSFSAASRTAPRFGVVQLQVTDGEAVLGLSFPPRCLHLVLPLPMTTLAHRALVVVGGCSEHLLDLGLVIKRRVALYKPALVLQGMRRHGNSRHPRQRGEPHFPENLVNG
ncbi:hypothetical protein DY000_02028891 [Brassica cretica]|uniref:Uncharacterized protein n=1 Tax=Brassica cretica TaxID=69181 RepID=A0ABQ7DVA9_BRACR|nr:hypothetical protein DY000_02028891 [Brassica cretica]